MTTTVAVPEGLASWLDDHLDGTGPWRLERLPGGNSNETCLLSDGAGTTWVLRRPPQHALSASAHDVGREHRVLTAVAEAGAPAPRPAACCEDADVPGGPFLVMEHLPDAVSITDTLPEPWPVDAVGTLADEVVDALAAVHRVAWQEVGLDGFGRPDGFLARQVRRWYGQWERIACRPLPRMDDLATWLEQRRPPTFRPGLVHGDFHVDNCLFARAEPRLLAVIDWEMATIGDPLLDLGLLLAFWGPRPVDPPAMPALQAVSRRPGAPPVEHLVARYEQQVGHPVGDVAYYRVLALFKLASIIEAAYAQYRAGDLDTPYAAALERDVPALLEEAWARTG
ncbi:MAG: acyl-CoA dehydrogenase, putative phosphotransferase [uncultured Actinomycetospora sp.]|uniref:Acyl-CoA dehydrogenase, putative phosphotransferase n=1 Tax=uncultured Actinomycetospora sp. TaxID=1135996 RepID=A0A6J4IYE2_9PSEU|nr:MAG: acyl-CoA dehydrogenase, putative phosphotransferase [uncultured Actinomycetospora sp.]